MTLKLPSYNIKQILKLQQQLIGSPHIRQYFGEKPTGVKFDEFVRTLQKELPGSLDIHTLYDSCEYLLGEVLAEVELDSLAWRLAGNLRQLRQRQPVLPWAGIPETAWSPAQVVDISPSCSSKGRIGGEFSLLLLAGPAAGLEMVSFWTVGYCYMLSDRLGFSKSWGELPLRDFTEFMDLRLYAELSAGTEELRYEHLAFPGSCRTWNRRWIKMRARHGFNCPEKFPDEHYCFRCPIGKDRCPAAVHADTYVKKYCKRCDAEKYFAAASRRLCVDCTNYLLTHARE